MPLSFVGCDSGEAVTVGTDSNKPIPPEVQERLNKQNAEYGQMQQQLSQPTPTESAPPPGGG